MSSDEKKRHPVRPDEWGMYDPQKAGMPALVDRLVKRAPRRQDTTAETDSASRKSRIRYPRNSR
jgi:hypothetical protein